MEMENSMGMAMGTQVSVCVRNCANCVKAREAGHNFRGQPCYTCRRNPGEPETLRHLTRSNCDSHMFPEERVGRMMERLNPGVRTTYVQMAAF